MSTPGHGSGDPLEGDGIDIKKILLVGVGSLATFAFSAFVAYLILRHDTQAADEAGRPPVPTMIGKAEIGIVDQPVFDDDHRLEDWKAAKQRRLDSYGWVDRQKNLIHVPIDKAIDQVVAGAAAGNQK
jgi:hypothetical protein